MDKYENLRHEDGTPLTQIEKNKLDALNSTLKNEETRKTFLNPETIQLLSEETQEYWRGAGKPLK